MTDKLARYFSGEKLYGDDFTIEEILEWFADEAEGYADLGSKNKAHYSYSYHALNCYHGYRFLKGKHFNNALGVGSAYGEEFKPIAKNISNLTILDPSDAFADTNEIFGLPCKYQKPNPNGNIEYEDNHFSLITSLGVMHHIPNVSHVLNECSRCLEEKGIMLLREPITSMGDWRKPRSGLTKRERGIPLNIFDQIIADTGLKVLHKSLCIFPVIPRIANKLGITAYNNHMFTVADSLLSKLFSWKTTYHRTNIFEKFAPASVYYVLTKQTSS